MPSRATAALSVLSVPLLALSALTAAGASAAAGPPSPLTTISSAQDLAAVNAQGLTTRDLTVADLRCLAGTELGALSAQQLRALVPGDLVGKDLAPCLTAAEAAPAPAPRPAPPAPGRAARADGPLAWAPPVLVDPTTVTLTERRPFQVLDDTKDYVVTLPGGRLTLRPDQKAGVLGGRNVVWIGGEIDAPGNPRPIKLDRQRGSVHLEGVHVTGRGLQEGINLDQRWGASVTIENVLVDKVSGNQRGHHADVLQTWSGPGRLRVDRLEGTTDYQGIMIDTQGFGSPTVTGFDLRHVVLRHTGVGYQDVDRGYLVRRTARSGGWPLEAQDVVLVHPTKNITRLVMGPGDWAGFTVARSAPSPLVGTPGADYVSPGYAG